MRTPTKLAVFGLTLAAIFAIGFTLARAVVPDDAPAAWGQRVEKSSVMSDHGSGSHDTVPGLASATAGYQLRDVTAPDAVDRDGPLRFRLTGPDAEPVDDYTTSHDKDLHLIVVRSDGTQFRHVHPNFDGDGTWSLPWRWAAAGTYRIFTDFVPAGHDDAVVLTSTVSVGGDFEPRPVPDDSTAATVDGFTVTLAGTLHAGDESDLKFTVTRDGKPVTTLEPYLGAYGHLMALRATDLGYLHVHPHGEPGDGVTAPGPDVHFMAAAPTDGKYYLYLDFQVDGQVHTAQFAVTAHAGH